MRERTGDLAQRVGRDARHKMASDDGAAAAAKPSAEHGRGSTCQECGAESSAAHVGRVEF